MRIAFTKRDEERIFAILTCLSFLIHSVICHTRNQIRILLSIRHRGAETQDVKCALSFYTFTLSPSLHQKRALSSCRFFFSLCRGCLSCLGRNTTDYSCCFEWEKVHKTDKSYSRRASIRDACVGAICRRPLLAGDGAKCDTKLCARQVARGRFYRIYQQ